MRKNVNLYFSLCLLSLLWSCSQFNTLDDIDTVRYEGEYAIPLVNTQLSMRDVLKNFEEQATVIIDPNGLLRLHYEGDVISQTSDDIFNNINSSLPPLIPVTSRRMELPLNTPNGLEIDEIVFKSGSIVYAFQSKQTEPMNVTIRFPQVHAQNGEMLAFNTYIGGYSGTGSLPNATNLFIPASLKDYRLSAENGAIYIEYEASKINGDPGELSNFFVRLQDLAFSYAEGYLGNVIFEGGRDTINIDFFNDWINGDIYFEQPKITYYLENSFGLPTRSLINVLQVQSVKGEILPLVSDVVGAGKGIDFAYPGLDEIGQSKTTTFTFNRDNSNIAQIVGSGPVAIDYEINALTNPENNLGIRGFITDSSYYKVRMEVDLPMYGQASGFVARDTIAVSLENWQDIDAAEFKMVTENNLPLDVVVQGYFVNPNGMVLDSLLAFPQRLITGAPVDKFGDVTGPALEINYAPFPPDRFQNIKTADRILLEVRFSTTNNGTVPVKVYSSQDVKVKVGAKLKIANQ